MHRRRKAEGFNLAFLDIMACGLGAIVLVFMVVKHNVSKPTAETDLLAGDVKRLEFQQEELQQSLDHVRSAKQSEAEQATKLKAERAQLNQLLGEKDRILLERRKQIADVKKNITTTPIAKREDPVQGDRGGEEDYLMGLKVEGRRIVILVDSSASMTDDTLIEIIKRKNGSEKDKKRGPKWLRTKNIVRWILARAPRGSRLVAISFNDSAESMNNGNWMLAGEPEGVRTLYRELDAIVPEGGTNLQQGLKAVAQYEATDLYVITDGLPTVGDSRYGSLNPFAGCRSLLGKAATISGACRVKLFRQTVQDSSPQQSKINVILLPIEGDPDAVNEFWRWASRTGGLVISPAENWP